MQGVDTVVAGSDQVLVTTVLEKALALAAISVADGMEVAAGGRGYYGY